MSALWPRTAPTGAYSRVITAGFGDTRNGVQRSFCAAVIRNCECPKWVKSDVLGARTDVGYAPINDLFDHLVGDGEYARGDRQAEGFGGLEIDN